MPTYVVTLDSRTHEVTAVTEDGVAVPWVAGVSDRDPPFFLVSQVATKVKLRRVDADRNATLIDPGSVSVVQAAPVEKKAEKKQEKADAPLPPYQLTMSGNLNADTERTFAGFETGADNQGDVHFAKHGEEVGAGSKAEYIQMAKAFGADRAGTYADFFFGKTFVRCDVATCARRRVFIAHERHIRSFYVWSRAFAREPFAFAIAFTIERTSRPERLRRDLWHAELAKHGIDYLAGCQDTDMAAPVNALHAYFKAQTYVEDPDAAVERWMPAIVKRFGGIPTTAQVESWLRTVWID